MQQAVTFYSEGCKLSGDLYLPDGLRLEERRAGIVLCHGYTGVKDLYLPDNARALNAVIIAPEAEDLTDFVPRIGAQSDTELTEKEREEWKKNGKWVRIEGQIQFRPRRDRRDEFVPVLQIKGRDSIKGMIDAPTNSIR